VSLSDQELSLAAQYVEERALRRPIGMARQGRCSMCRVCGRTVVDARQICAACHSGIAKALLELVQMRKGFAQ
jgi:uncharacterized OB-fold protein